MSDDLNQWAIWREIHSQPKLSQAWGTSLDVEGLRAWIRDQDANEVWFCGAGTSAYIGDIIAAGLHGARAVPSTDLVGRPQHFCDGVRPLVVSFGRSGNCTESIGDPRITRTAKGDQPAGRNA